MTEQTIKIFKLINAECATGTEKFQNDPWLQNFGTYNSNGSMAVFG
jgi:hypothetical protein